MPKTGVTLTDEMNTALSRHAEMRGAPVAVLIREAIQEWLERHGDKVESKVTWGGKRTAKKKSRR